MPRRERFKKGERIRLGSDPGVVLEAEDDRYPAVIKLDSGRVVTIEDRMLLPGPEPSDAHSERL